MRSYKSVIGLGLLFAALSGLGCGPDPCVVSSQDVSGWTVAESPREAKITPVLTCGKVVTGYIFEIDALPASNVFWKMEYVDTKPKGGSYVSMSIDMADTLGVSTTQRIQIETLNRTEFGYAVPKVNKAVISAKQVPTGLDGVVRSFTVMLPSSGKFVTEVSNFLY